LQRPPSKKWLVQQYIAGSAWLGGFFADGGQVVQTLLAERDRSANQSQNLTITFKANEELKKLVNDVVQALGLSGFGQIEAIFDDRGRPFLVGVRPYPPRFAHLGSVVGPDLVAALAAHLHSATYRPGTYRNEQFRVALFPVAIERDPSGRCLEDSFHDVPWEDDRLLGALQGKLPISPAVGRVFARLGKA
jgi:hypothetical protein